MVRILAARFPDRERATRALESIHDHIDNGIEAQIAPLATDRTAAADTLLAGHFDEHQKPQVEELVRDAGGEIVADVDERWTLPRHSSLGGTREGGGGFTY